MTLTGLSWYNSCRGLNSHIHKCYRCFRVFETPKSAPTADQFQKRRDATQNLPAPDLATPHICPALGTTWGHQNNRSPSIDLYACGIINWLPIPTRYLTARYSCTVAATCRYAKSGRPTKHTLLSLKALCKCSWQGHFAQWVSSTYRLYIAVTTQVSTSGLKTKFSCLLQMDIDVHNTDELEANMCMFPMTLFEYFMILNAIWNINLTT